MATTSTIIVSTVARNYEPQWHELYEEEIKQGNTSVEVHENTEENLESLVRRSHSSLKKVNVEKHYESVEDRFTDPDTGDVDLVKVGITITFRKGNPISRGRAEALAAGYIAELSTDGVEDITRGKLNR